MDASKLPACIAYPTSAAAITIEKKPPTLRNPYEVSDGSLASGSRYCHPSVARHIPLGLTICHNPSNAITIAAKIRIACSPKTKRHPVLDHIPSNHTHPAVSVRVFQRKEARPTRSALPDVHYIAIRPSGCQVSSLIHCYPATPSCRQPWFEGRPRPPSGPANSHPPHLRTE